MADARPNPTLRNLRLRQRLRSIRLEQGKRIEDVAEAAGLSPSALSRMENGNRKILPRTIRLLAEPLNLTEAQKNELITLAKEAEQHGWWTEYGQAVPQWFDSYVGLEAAADSIRVYENELVHGLLQTPEYARAVYLGGTAAYARGGTGALHRASDGSPGNFDWPAGSRSLVHI